MFLEAIMDSSPSAARRPGAARRLARHGWAALGLIAGAAHAGTGLLVLDGTPPVTLAYPTDTPDAAIARGPYTLQAAPNAPSAGGNGRLVVLSHGSGGGVETEFDLAQALVRAGFTVAMPMHAGDNWQDLRDAGPVAWARRPQELSQAIDAVATLAAPGGRLAPLRLDLQRVGVYGMSAGGIAALTLAGARWSPAMQARHCDAHLAQDFPACVGLAAELTGGLLDGAKLAAARWAIQRQWAGDTTWRSAQDPRVAAVVAAVPVASPIDMASLAPPRVPLGLVRAGHDDWLAPRFHVDAVQAACAPSRLASGQPGCTLLADMAEGGHGSTLSPPPVGLPPRAARLLDDPPGFDRARTLPAVYQAIAAFFQTRLGTPPP
jgi:predicted dienelactone hydrolase